MTTAALALMLAVTAEASISVQLAKSCRAMMIKAHPVEVFGAKGSAAAQRAYFADCVRHNGDMPQARQDAGHAKPSTTGQGE